MHSSGYGRSPFLARALSFAALTEQPPAGGAGGYVHTRTRTDNETLVRLGTSAITSLITLNLSHLTSAQLDYLCASIGKLFDGTLPHQLLEYRFPDAPAPVSASSGGAAVSFEHEIVSTAALEAALVVPPLVLAVLVDPRDESGGSAGAVGVGNSQTIPGAAAATLSDSATESSSMRESRLTMVPPAGSTPIPERMAANKILRARFQTIVAKCTLQLLLIQTVNDLVNQAGQDHYRALGPMRLLAISANLERSYRFANSFNSNLSLRRALSTAGTACARAPVVVARVADLRASRPRTQGGLGGRRPRVHARVWEPADAGNVRVGLLRRPHAPDALR